MGGPSKGGKNTAIFLFYYSSFFFIYFSISNLYRREGKFVSFLLFPCLEKRKVISSYTHTGDQSQKSTRKWHPIWNLRMRLERVGDKEFWVVGASELICSNSVFKKKGQLPNSCKWKQNNWSQINSTGLPPNPLAYFWTIHHQRYWYIPSERAPLHRNNKFPFCKNPDSRELIFLSS